MRSTFEVTDAAVALLAERGYEPEYGARPLRRVIQREIDDRISDLFVSGALGDGEGVRVDAADGEFVVVPGAARDRGAAPRNPSVVE